MNLTPEGTKIPILMYHSVADDPTKETRRLSVLVDRFERQIEALRDGGYTGVTFSELGARGFGGPHDGVKPVVITFDDGYADFYNNAFPVLHEYGFPATLFVTTGWIADAGAYAAGRRLAPTLSWSQIVELSQSGVEIGAHGHSHAQLDQLNLQDLAVELTLPRQLLEARLQHSVKAIAYP